MLTSSFLPEEGQSTKENLFLISTYHPGGNPLKNIIQNNWDLLDKSSSTRKVLDWRVISGFRRPPNLRDLLVKAKVQPPNVEASRGDGNPLRICRRGQDCKYCRILLKTGQIACERTHRTYNTIRNCSCKSNNLIYCIVCTKCAKKYVGHTKRTLAERMCEHFRNVTQNNTNHSVGRHFNSTGHNGLNHIRIYILQFCNGNPDNEGSLRHRLHMERVWINRLRTSAPHGLNVFD